MQEIVSLLATAKGLGFDVGHIISMFFIYVLLDRSFAKRFDKLITAIESLERGHNNRLIKLETQVGLKKTKRR